VLTDQHPLALSGAVAAQVQQVHVLRLANPHDADMLGVAGDSLREAPPGRAVRADTGETLQLAVFDETPTPTAALAALARELREAGVRPVPQLRNAPTRIMLADLPTSHAERPVFGIETATLAPATLPAAGLAVVCGHAGAGLSTAVNTVHDAVQRYWQGLGVETDVVVLRPALDAEATAAAAHELCGRLDLAASSPFPEPGKRGVIVVERACDAEGTVALPALVALARAARRADALVVFEFELGGLSSWELGTALQQPRWGVILQPDENDAPSPLRATLGRVRRADSPPGRGYAVERGRATPVQVALPDPRDPSDVHGADVRGLLSYPE